MLLFGVGLIPFLFWILCDCNRDVALHAVNQNHHLTLFADPMGLTTQGKQSSESASLEDGVNDIDRAQGSPHRHSIQELTSFLSAALNMWRWQCLKRQYTQNPVQYTNAGSV